MTTNDTTTINVTKRVGSRGASERLRVLHLVGSATTSWYADLSLLYARGCLAATADPERYDTVIAHISPDGSWRFPDDATENALRRAAPAPLVEAVPILARLGADVAVPHLFDLPGMTTYRGLLDLLRIPYVGNTAAVMALAADKAQTRAVVAAAGVRIPHGEVLEPGAQPTVPPPSVVKPVNADNSHGVALIRNAADYPAALAEARRHSDRVLVEELVAPGREVRCGILAVGGQLRCLPLEEYPVTVDSPVRLAQDKVEGQGTVAGGSGLRLVAKTTATAWVVDPADPVTEQVWAAARRCHTALRCRHHSLFDFRIDPAGQAWFLEAGLYCSFSPQSVIPTMARAAGMRLDTLFAASLAEART